MKVIVVGKDREGEGRLSGVNRSIGNLVPTATRTAQKSQDEVIELFRKILDHRFILLQGVRLEGFDGIPPLVLVGPPGLWIIEASPVSGMFRAASSAWDEMDARAHMFRPARPNLTARIINAGRALDAFLATTLNSLGELPAVEPVILFTHPGAHLELHQPAARMIQADGIGRFAAGLLRRPAVFEKETIQAIADRLGQTSADLAYEEIAEGADLTLAQTPAAPSMVGPKMPPIPEEEPDLVKRLAPFTAFSRFQWTILGLLLALVILVLLAVILILFLIT